LRGIFDASRVVRGSAAPAQCGRLEDAHVRRLRDNAALISVIKVSPMGIVGKGDDDQSPYGVRPGQIRGQTFCDAVGEMAPIGSAARVD
jgi:hypothetical protein